ncbi:MAG: putative LmbE-like protein [Actinomycetia bacterium]|nr:putative LmbE-like protein [Actinomycetes bacterium]
MTDEVEIERILVVVAHPDDVDFSSAGSIAGWTSEGREVSYCIVTDGDAGGSDPSISRQEMAQIRRREQTAAAAVVGVSDIHWLGYADGRLQSTIELRRDISKVIRIVRPQRVLSSSPQRDLTRMYASHPDHLAAGEAALSAVYPDARNEFAHPELLADGYEPWSVPEVWIIGTPEPDRFTDITDQIDRKLEALRCHVSQLPDPDGIGVRLRDMAAATARRAALPEGRYAEGFRYVATA